MKIHPKSCNFVYVAEVYLSVFAAKSTEEPQTLEYLIMPVSQFDKFKKFLEYRREMYLFGIH